jgi:hypothetical protein
MDRECHTCGGDENDRELWSKYLKARDHLRDLGVDRRIILQLT